MTKMTANPSDESVGTVSDKPTEDELKKIRNSILRDIRVEIEEVVLLIEQHVAGEIDIFRHINELEDSGKDVHKLVTEISKNHLEKIDRLRRDTYSRIINIWELTEKNPFFTTAKALELQDPKKEQERLRELNVLKSRLERLTYYLVYATGMERINNWIDAARPGYALPFHAIFEDELKKEDDRNRMLGLYSLSPVGMHGGLVDVARGIILCYPKSPWDRFIRHLINILQLVLWFALLITGTQLLITYGADFGFNMKPLSEFSLIPTWSALLLGILGHGLVAGAKQPAASFRQFPLPLSDWGFYLTARTSVLIYKSALAFFVFWAMYLSLNGEIGLSEAFLIGYSFDSVAELVGLSLEKRAQTNITAIKDKLGLPT